MWTFEKFIKDLYDGYVLEFEYMNCKHHITYLDEDKYSIIKYTQDNKHKREERRIVNTNVVEEMFKFIQEITYVY